MRKGVTAMPLMASQQLRAANLEATRDPSSQLLLGIQFLLFFKGLFYLFEWQS